MLGQDKISNSLLKPIVRLPKSILLIGEQGCGKHTIVREISEMNNIDVVDITNNLTLDYINEILISPIQKIYLIDTSSITEREQNVILKLVEEPPMSATIILLCENKTSLLDTIINRCSIFTFDSYDKELLSTFVEDKEQEDLILSLCNTPGQIINMHSKNIQELKDLCEKFVTKLNVANYQNTLTIANKINFSDEYDKFDLIILFRMMINVLMSNIKNTNDIVLNALYVNMYFETNQFINRLLKDSRLNKQQLFDNYLTTMWKVSRGIN